MVTVLIPTVARSAMLRMALQSVADQTALRKISRVYVSENGGDRASEAVCAEFPQLPITYLFQEPAVGPLEHAQILMKRCLEGEFTCILHDDDWCLPIHLEAAIDAFGLHPDASVYGANLILQAESTYSDRNCEHLAWFGANYPPPTQVWLLTHSNVLIASLIGLVVHYSSMVVRTEALQKCAFVYDLGNSYDNDRMLLLALSQHGPVLFNSNLTLGVRIHADRETVRFGEDERGRQMAQTTEWMVGLGLKPWAAIASIFVQRLVRCPNQAVKIYLLREATVRPWCLPEIARHLDRARDKDFFAMYDQARLRFAGVAPQADR